MTTAVSNIHHFTNASFDTSINSSKNPVFVDFWAPWCGPCKMMEPILDTFAEQHGDSVMVAKVNVDEEPELARRYNVRSIPTIVVFKGGQELSRLVGAVDKIVLDSKVRSVSS